MLTKQAPAADIYAGPASADSAWMSILLGRIGSTVFIARRKSTFFQAYIKGFTQYWIDHMMKTALSMYTSVLCGSR